MFGVRGSHPEDPVLRVEERVARERALDEKGGEGPLRREKREHEDRADDTRQRERAEPAVEALHDEIDAERRNDHQRRKRQRHHVRDRLVDRAELRRRRKELNEPHQPEHDRGEECRGRRRGPAQLDRARERGECEGKGNGGHLVVQGAMHHVALAVFREEEREVHEKEAAGQREQHRQALAPAFVLRAILLREREQERSDDDREDADREERMRRADDLHVEAVRVVPPVVERR